MEKEVNQFFNINSKLIECENNTVIKVNSVLVAGMSIEEKLLLGSILNYDVIVKYNFYSKTAEIDGKNAVRLMMSELAVNAQVNNLDRIVNASIENAFKEVVDALQIGWWVTAKDKALLIVPSQYVTQAFIDRVITKLDDYISINY